MIMIEFIYGLLESLGYTHPLHPAITHIPMGMIIGGFIFRIASFKWEQLAKTAYYCFILALIFAPITALFGFMDWQHRLFGKMNGFIMAKFILTGCLVTLLSVTIFLDNKNILSQRAMTLFYVFCFLIAVGLGFVGGELAYG